MTLHGTVVSNVWNRSRGDAGFRSFRSFTPKQVGSVEPEQSRSVPPVGPHFNVALGRA